MIFFVTGGSRGIGRAIVLDAASQGHQVAFTYLERSDAAREVEREALALDSSAVCRAYQLDVRSSADVERVGDEVLRDFETVDVVVSNAGTLRDGLVATMSDEDWCDVLQTNLTGSFFVVRQFLPTMLASGRGRIVLISSIGSSGRAGQANYAASKAGLQGLSGSLAKEYGRKGITSNVILPGYFDTELTRGQYVDHIRQFCLSYAPIGRPGEMQELTSLVLFLASDQAAYINGQAITVSGGLDWLP